VVWQRDVPAAGSVHRVLPDGCLDVIWCDGELFVAGPDTRAQVTPAALGTRYVALRFAPGVGPAVVGAPAHELRDRRVPLADLWSGPHVRRLAARIAEAVDRTTDAASGITDAAGGITDVAGGIIDRTARSTGATRGAARITGLPAAAAVLERAAATRLRPPDPAIRGIVAGLRAGAPVAAVADATGLSPRQLHRRCLPAFGYGPKTLARILRLERAVAMARVGTPFAAVAALTGYADQAHLARDVRALAGVPLGELVR
jgi:AraC-like DNA-binding protein